MATTGLSAKRLIGRKTPAETVCCSRCAGLMVIEESFDSMTGRADVDFQVKRCVQCGEVIDPVILQNRRAQLGYDLGRSEKERLFAR